MLIFALNLGALPGSNLGAHAPFGRRAPKEPTPAYIQSTGVRGLRTPVQVRIVTTSYTSTAVLEHATRMTNALGDMKTENVFRKFKKD